MTLIPHEGCSDLYLYYIQRMFHHFTRRINEFFLDLSTKAGNLIE